MKRDTVILGARLQAIADEVRSDVNFYDVGTDHAYLPTYLLQTGRLTSATASDIVPGPLAAAAETIARAGMTERVTLILTDGLHGIDLRPPCDVVIAGMGGEMIAAILTGAPQARNGDVRFLLQPMTKIPELRTALASNGFAVEKEFVVSEGKLYPILVCRYDGRPYSLTEEELLLGRRGTRVEDELFYDYAAKLLSVYQTVADGKRRGGTDPAAEEEKIALLRRILTKKENTI